MMAAYPVDRAERADCVERIDCAKTTKAADRAEPAGPRRQRGAALFIALVVLVVLAMLGAAAMQSSGLAERMAGQQIDRDAAFQAAEAALRDAETWTYSNLTALSAFNTTCASGLCLPSQTATQNWDSVNWTGATPITYGANTGAVSIPGLTSQPKYIIELLPDIGAGPGSSAKAGTVGGGTAFRITAMAWGRKPGTQVMLQSVYVKQ